jgi:uncharacterized protein (DUF2461 family)
MRFGGFGAGAFAYFERAQAAPTWAAIQALRGDWDRHVHAPMEALLDQLGEEFGRDAYAYNLHRDRYLWLHQVGIISLADNIGYRLVLSVEGLVAEGGWRRSSPDQVQRYREAISSDGTGAVAHGLVSRAQQRGAAIDGQRLARSPRGWPADHPRMELLRYRTLVVSRQVPAARLSSGPDCVRAVAAALGELRPLTAWLAEHVGPRQP